MTKTQTLQRWYIRRIKLNRQGYDNADNYYGSGTPLWWIYSADNQNEFFIRGHRDYARAAYQWARLQRDITAACQHLTQKGVIAT